MINLRREQYLKDSENLIFGYELVVTLSFSTPYSYLEKAGMIVLKHRDCFSVPMQYGIWVASLNGHPHKGRRASCFGHINLERALPLLKAYRLIVERALPPEEKFISLNKLSTNKIWLPLIRKALDGRCKTLGEYWAINELRQIKGVGPAKAKKLIAQGIYTVEQYNKNVSGS